MSGLFGSGGKVAKAAPEASSLRVTTACYGRPIPLGWGQFKVAGFVLWYDDFKAIAHEQSQGGKGGDSYTSVNYTYQASLVVGICEGPINDVTAVWKDKEYYSYATTSSKTYRKQEVRYVPASGIVALNAPGTITAVLGVTIPWRWNSDKISGVTFVSPTDYTRSGATFTFTNADAFNQQVTFVYEYTITAPDSPMTKIGMTLGKGTYPQSIWSYLTTNHPAQAIPYSGIAVGYATTYELGASPAMPNTSFEVDSGMGYSTTVRDVNPADFIPDYLCNPYYGAYFPSDMLGDMSNYGDYCIASGLLLSPEYTEQAPAAETMARVAAVTNSDWTLSDGKLKLVPYADKAVTGNGKTWTPNLTAQYDLGPDDFVSSGGDPIIIKRKDPTERYNYVRVKYRSREIQYNDDVAEGKDEAEIGRNGLRPAPQETEVPEVKVRATAKAIADLLVQRTVNVCNTYEFTLKKNKCGLEPMDLVSLTHPDYFLSQALVRLIVIDEQEDGTLRCEAEEVPIGTASSIAYPTETPLGYAANYNVAPGNTNQPSIFELPSDVTGYQLAIGVAAFGSGTNWGGCEVWASYDGTTYQQIGEVRGGSRYGQITTVVGSTVGVSISTGQLLSGSASDLNARATLCYIGGSVPEYFAYQTAALTGTLAYTLSTLSRGLYASRADSAHTIADTFVRVDDSVAMSGPLDTNLVGKTISIKLLSFNKYGGGKQTLADVSAWSYTVTGNFIKSPSLNLNNYDLTNGNEGWTGIGAIGTDDSSASGGTYGVFSAGIGSPAYPRPVAVDPNRLYRVTVRVKVIGGTGGSFYAGVVCFDRTGALLSNSLGGNYPYCCAQGQALPANQWLTFVGYMTGSIAYPTTDPMYLTKFPVGTVEAAPTLFPYTGFSGTLLVDYAMIEDITAASAQADGLAFNPYRTWDFNANSSEGWTATGATLSVGGSELYITSTGVDPNLIFTGLSFFGGNFDRVRMKVRRVAGSGWDGTLFYATPGHTFSASFLQNLPADRQPSYVGSILEWDMSKLASGTGGTDWLGSVITSLRFDLGATSGDQFAIDWIAIGKQGPSADLSVVSNAQWVGRGCAVVGDTAWKITTSGFGWDSDVYSVESYRGGCFASASFDVGSGGAVMFGLNSDPLTDSNYTSLDFAWYYDGVNMYTRHAGVFSASWGAPAAGDVFSVVYDGSRVNYLKNGVLISSGTAFADLVLFFDSSFNSTLTSRLVGMRFGPLSANNWVAIGNDNGGKPADYATADLVLINDSNCVQQGNRVTKTSGAATWDAGMHSRDGYKGGAAVTIVVHGTETTSGYEKMFGLNNNPTTSAYTDINFAMYMVGSGGGVGQLYTYLEGVGGISLGTYADNDVLSVTYDGYKARWYKNGVQLTEVVSIDTTSTWYFDCSIVQVGEFLDRISFRPMTPASGINTPQLSAGAVVPTHQWSATPIFITWPNSSAAWDPYILTAPAHEQVVVPTGQSFVDAVSAFQWIFSDMPAGMVSVRIVTDLTLCNNAGTAIANSIGNTDLVVATVPQSSTLRTCRGTTSTNLKATGLTPGATYRLRVTVTGIQGFDSTGAAIAPGTLADLTASARIASTVFAA